MWWLLLLTALSLLLLLAVWLTIDYTYGHKQLQTHNRPHMTSVQRADLNLFTTGEDFFDCFIRDINDATDHIHILFYIFNYDTLGKRVLTALEQKASLDVDVCLLVDRVGCHLPRKAKKRLKRAGISFAYARPVRGPLYFFSLNRRNHRKIAVIDGHIGYIGGYNVGDEYVSRDPKFGFWRDFHVRLTGAACIDIARQFCADWYEATEVRLPHMETPPDPSGHTSVQFLATNGIGLEKELCAFISQSKKTCFIATPYYIPSNRLQRVVEDAARRGVDVRILLPEKADHLLVTEASHRYLIRALQAGTTVYHYYRGFYHAKALIVDGETCFIGTANFDRRSLHLNDEMGLLTHDSVFTRQVIDCIEHDMSVSMHVTLEALEKRPWHMRLREKIGGWIEGVL
ncbi:cardiolipin synthase [Shouchella lonarensis]|uniref:Cardiolipin synthase n=1 Tax=Shouchella lonarensis TaxID=1464122 RepID=A0A1G6GVW4_9BACI|nr:cardiolipin synthase [Shouchella lonarensis]SDB86172.1 cardiolipin synthase [Shouchella lonarensis]